MPSIAAKLHVKAGMKLALLNPPKEHKNIFGDLPTGCTVIYGAGGKADLVLVFAASVKELDALLPKAMKFLSEDTPLWVGFPKQTGSLKSDLARDKGWDSVKKAGYRPVSIIAVDETWSAMRLRRKELVKSQR